MSIMSFIAVTLSVAL